MTVADDSFKELRSEMVSRQIFSRGITDPKILEAFKSVARHIFVPDSQKSFAYNDCPLPIGNDQTISQPFIVALMTKTLDVKAGMRVLEIGTGSGYQAAILGFLGAKVYSVERIEPLAKKAQELFSLIGYKIAVKIGDGTLGWPENSPYDRIIVTAAAPEIPEALITQLKIEGRLVIPLGERFTQDLVVVCKISQSEVKKESICGCRFVPLVGEYGWN